MNSKPTLLAGAVAFLFAASAAQVFAQPVVRRIEPDSIRPPDGYIALRIQARTTVPAEALAQIFADLTRHTAYFPRFVAEARQISCATGTLTMSYTTLFRPKTGGIDTVRSVNRMQLENGSARLAYRWKSERVTNGYIDAIWGVMLFTTVREARASYTIIDYISGVHPRNSIKKVAVWSHRDRLAEDAGYFVKQLIDQAAKPKQTELPLFPCGTANRSDA